MNPIFEQISRRERLSVEVSNAHLLIEDDRLASRADRVNEAVPMGSGSGGCTRRRGPKERTAPQSVPPVQRLMQSRAAEARQLAWSLLRAGLDEISELSESVRDRRLGEL
jgi:hypothetical protein